MLEHWNAELARVAVERGFNAAAHGAGLFLLCSSDVLMMIGEGIRHKVAPRSTWKCPGPSCLSALCGWPTDSRVT